MSVPAELLEHRIAPNRLPDTEWLNTWLARADRREPILLGLGERWEGIPGPLAAALATVPASAHGYQLSMYGLPRLRAVLRDYIRDTHHLAGHEDRFEVAVSWTGTRSVMLDFAGLVAARQAGRPALALAVAPSWDYAGVVEPAGFTMAYLDPAEPGGWLPDAATVAAWEPPADRHLGLVVINAQHNPTGLDLGAGTVQAMIALAVRHGAAVLIDDAYYGFADPADEPASALHHLLEDPRADGLTWLAVRSLGKQFNCNGWALGAVTASPALLDELVNGVRANHTYNHGGHLQSAMASWLADRAAVEAYLADERRAYAARRQVAVRALAAAGVSDVVAGPAGPYLLFPVPAGFSRHDYLRRAAVGTGVLMSDAWPATRPLDPHTGRHIRMYLGREPAQLAEAVDRLARAGLLPAGD
ncbi:pyridoxal phosphate-dependent aminotransferase [Actinoplanes sp. N902-109]|uniref:pyridoxal phosphate-dependent aminotransferase n=1 Tax=Actinoplanes sp. (strain N902-109) TaxID=649831 RepID=UPI000329383F|nr:pyridoxal phosphate-dependent aminotransferase [Actinoplanes sp. N902-109]AGL19165.1 class I and II aminotransferase [Actinoplanes sp. N902-109]